MLLADHNVKNFNKHAVADLIHLAGKGISRTDIAQDLGLTRAGTAITINDRIENGRILETESRSTRSGRPPVVLETNPRSRLVAAIDMGASSPLEFLMKQSSRFRPRMARTVSKAGRPRLDVHSGKEWHANCRQSSLRRESAGS
jgi:hypothetical protein